MAHGRPLGMWRAAYRRWLSSRQGFYQPQYPCPLLLVTQYQHVITPDNSRVVITPGADSTGRPLPPANALVIFLHGLGDSAQAWTSVWFQLAIKYRHVKFVLPNAPRIPVTVNKNEVMPSWFDLVGKSSRAEELCEGIEESRSVLQNMIAKEIEAGIPARRIILGGFSQGGALALYTALKEQQGLGGAISLSGYLPSSELNATERSKDTPVLLCHGAADQVVPLKDAVLARDRLKSSGYSVDYHEFKNLSHDFSMEEYDVMSRWIGKMIP